MLRALNHGRTEFREDSWRAFWRTVVDNIDTDVVAKELRMSAASVRQARSRIMRRLRTELGDGEV